MLIPNVSRIGVQAISALADDFLCGDLKHLHARRNVRLSLPQFFVSDVLLQPDVIF